MMMTVFRGLWFPTFTNVTIALTIMDTIETEKIYPNSMVMVANRLRRLDETITSLSLVVNPVPVSKDMTWKRAFLSVMPVIMKSTVNTSTNMKKTDTSRTMIRMAAFIVMCSLPGYS
jgi:hypothetical protein